MDSEMFVTLYDRRVPLAEKAITDARRTRARLRRRHSKSLERNPQLEAAIAELQRVGKLLRPLIGTFQWDNVGARREQKLTQLSLASQDERRKLRKMLR